MGREVQTGKAVLWGINATSTQIAVEGIGGFIMESMKGVHNFKITDLEDEAGFDTTAVAVNAHIEQDMTWIPADTTRALAVAGVVYLEPLAKVTVSECAVAAFNGDWQYRGGQSIDLTHAAGKITLKLRKYDDEAQNKSLTTKVS